MTTGRTRLASRVADLAARRTPFVSATVVRAQCPTSARPGDAAVILSDGTIEGFIGGQCAEGSVKAAALGLLDSGEALLLRIVPSEALADAADDDGSLTVVNPCLSGGAIEVFLEPKLPAPGIVVVGTTPIADSLAVQAEHLGYAVERSAPDTWAGTLACVIASHGRDEDTSIRAALGAGVAYVGLVASPKRGRAVVDALDLNSCEASRVRSPAGLNFGARTAEEIALSILAEIVSETRAGTLRMVPGPTIELPNQVIDPVCGMTVMVGPDTAHLANGADDYWFCNPGCRDRFAEELAG